jgi:hypothetical protein
VTHFNRRHHADTTYIGHQWNIPQCAQLLLEVGRDIPHVIQQLFPLNNIPTGKRRRARHRIGRPRIPIRVDIAARLCTGDLFHQSL